jgi:hypothetical protein
VALHESLLRNSSSSSSSSSSHRSVLPLPPLPQPGCTRVHIQDYLDTVNQIEDVPAVRATLRSFLEVEDK